MSSPTSTSKLFAQVLSPKSNSPVLARSEQVDLIYRRFLELYHGWGGNVDLLDMPYLDTEANLTDAADCFIAALIDIHGDDWCCQQKYRDGMVNLLASVFGYLSEWDETGRYGLAEVAGVLAQMHEGNDRELSWYHIRMYELMYGLAPIDPLKQVCDEDGYASDYSAYLGRYAYDTQTKKESAYHRNSDGLAAKGFYRGHRGALYANDPTALSFYYYQREVRETRLCIATALKVLAEPLYSISGAPLCGWWTHKEQNTVRLCAKAWCKADGSAQKNQAPNLVEVLLRQAIQDCIANARGDMSLLEQYESLLDAQSKRLEASHELS